MITAAELRPDSRTRLPPNRGTCRRFPCTCRAHAPLHLLLLLLLLPRGPPSYYAATSPRAQPDTQPAQSVRHDESSQSPRGPLQLVPCNIELSSCAVPCG